MDTPAIQDPLDPQEQTILDRLLHIRDALLLLKHDRLSYIESGQVLSHYEELIAEAERIDTLRKKQREQSYNRLDHMLDSCYQMISLLFLTIGKKNDPPAMYSIATTIQRLLEHLKEAEVYNARDLSSIRKSLAEIRDIVERGKDKCPGVLLSSLQSRLEDCQSLLEKLEGGLAIFDPDFASVHDMLVLILRLTAAVNTRQEFSTSEVLKLQEQLTEAECAMKDSLDVTPRPGQDSLKALIGRCWRWTDIVLEREGKVNERFQARYEQLVDIRDQLQRLSATQAWSFRETDLFEYQRQLDRIDQSRVDANFVDAEGQPADLHTQRTLLYLIRRSYSYIFALLSSSEPVSEALLPIYNQLQATRQCLIEVQESGGCSNSRELYPYCMKLNSIDNMRIDGKFYVGSEIPQGQGNLCALLAECYDLVWELRASWA